jgi:hypothetical protein
MAVLWVVAPWSVIEFLQRPDDVWIKDRWNVGKLLPDYTALQPKDNHLRTYIICTSYQILLGWWSLRRWGGRVMYHAWKSLEINTKFLSEDFKGRDHLEDSGVNKCIKLECILKQLGEMVLTEFIWLKTGTSSGLLWTRKRTCGIQKRRGVPWLAKRLWAPQEELAPWNQLKNEYYRTILNHPPGTKFYALHCTDNSFLSNFINETHKLSSSSGTFIVESFKAYKTTDLVVCIYTSTNSLQTLLGVFSADKR